METKVRPAPLSPPDWITPTQLALVSIAIAAGMAAIPALARVDQRMAHEVAPSLVLCTTGLSVLLARRALRARTSGGVLFTTLMGGAVFGCINAGLVLGIQLLGEGKGFTALFGFLAGSIIGSFIGAPLGFAFGAAFSPVIIAAVRARDERTLDALEPVLVAAGAFLALVGAFVGWHHVLPFRFMGVTLVAGGFGCALLAFTRDAARVAWTRAVRSGRMPEYQIVSPSEGMRLEGLLPVFRSAGTLPEGVLTRVRLEGSGAPFRTMSDRTPLARIHLRAEDEHPVAHRRMVMSVVVMALAAACAVSPWMSTRAPGDLGFSRAWGAMD